MLEKGSFIFIPNDDLSLYLRERISYDDRLQLEEIAAFCFKYEAIATFLFINKTRNSKYNCCAYIPIYDSKDKFEQHINNFKDIKQSIYITALIINNIKELKNKELLDHVKRTALRMGYWSENYVLLPYREKPVKVVVNTRKTTIERRKQSVKEDESKSKPSKQFSNEAQIERIPLGLKGIFKIIPFSKIVTGKSFLLAFFISIIMTLIIYFFYYDKQIFFIDMVNNLIVSIIPTLLGFSIAGFAIILNQLATQISTPALERKKSNNYSLLYQENYADFSITVLAQFFPLIVAVFIKLIKPITIEIPTSFVMASIGNSIAILFGVMCFLYALFSIINLIITIFNTGLIINFSIFKK